MNPFPTVPPGYCFINGGIDGGLGEKQKATVIKKHLAPFSGVWLTFFLDYCASRRMWRCQDSVEVGGKAAETKSLR